jgi:hypothetical protein
MSAKRYQRSLLMRSSPAVCGPRSISRPSSTADCSGTWKTRWKLCSYRATRLPLDSNTRRQQLERVQRKSCTCSVTEVHQRVAAGFLVAAGDHHVEGERVAVGHGAGFFHQRGQHAGLQQGRGGNRRKVGKIIPVRMKNIVILISGSGSNMAAIVRTAQPTTGCKASWRPGGGGHQQPAGRAGPGAGARARDRRRRWWTTRLCLA